MINSPPPLVYHLSIFIFNIFSLLSLAAQTMGQCLPTQSAFCAPRLYHSLYCGCQLLVGCHVSSSNGGHLRPETRVSLYVLMWRQMAAKVKEPAPTSANPTTGALYGPVRSRGAMSWGCKIHEGKGHSRLGVGWWRLMLVVVCFGLLTDICVPKRTNRYMRSKTHCQKYAFQNAQYEYKNILYHKPDC